MGDFDRDDAMPCRVRMSVEVLWVRLHGGSGQRGKCIDVANPLRPQVIHPLTPEPRLVGDELHELRVL